LAENKSIYDFYKETKKTDHIAVFAPIITQCSKTNVIFADQAIDHFACRLSIWTRGMMNMPPGTACTKPD